MARIIAEIGVNWYWAGSSDDLERAKFMIIESKRAGADYVKFQLFNESNLGSADKNYDRLKTMILDLDKLSVLRDAARYLGIGFIVTPMYPEAFSILNEVVPDFIKIRYADKKNDLIAAQAVKFCRIHGIEILVSCDREFHGRSHSYSSIYQDNINIVNLMYCVPKYPPDLSEVNLSYEISERFNGYSNHIPSKFAPMVAVSRGIDFVEVHVMLKDSWPIDKSVSLTFDELKEVCDFRDFVSKLKG